MKMNKANRLACVLLALLLTLTFALPATAESALVIPEEEYHELAQTAASEMYTRLMNTNKYTSIEYVVLESIVDEQLDNILAYMTEEEIVAYKNYVMQLYQQAITQQNGVAGPFKEAVDVSASNVATFSALTREVATAAETENGLILNKSATYNAANDNYTITLETYTTGKVTTTTTTMPVDIVLVLDQSSSMTSTSFSNNGGTYQAGLATAFDAFIEDVVSKYSETADHRIAIVSFNSSGTTRQGWTDADSVSDFSTVATALDNSSYVSQGTCPDLGMELAVNLLTGSGYSYTGSNTTRQKICIMFSDGVPSTSGSTSYTTSYADTAINHAKTLKDAGVTVYSIGIFEDADPDELYGTTSASGTAGAVGYTWTTDYAAAGNRYLNYLSSNSSNATSDGLDVTTSSSGNNWGGGNNNNGTRTYEITANYAWSNQGYYLDAGSADELIGVFESISSNITTPSIELGTSTTINDYIMPQFTLPDGYSATAVKVYQVPASVSGTTTTWQGSWSADANGNITWSGTYTPLTVVTTTPQDGEVKVTLSDVENTSATATDSVIVEGFDFTENCVVTDPKEDGTYGSKLVIQFTVETTEGFLGGDGVFTNAAGSGVYDKDGALVEEYNRPDVDVQVPDLEILAADQHIYLSNYADLDELLQSFSVTYNIVDKNDEGVIVDRDGEYSVDTVLNYYTNLTFYLKDSLAENANTLASYTITHGKQDGVWTYDSNYWGVDQDGEDKYLKLLLTQDTPFYITYEAVSANNTTNKSSDTLTANVYVYTPEVTFQDSVEKYASTVTGVPDYYTKNDLNSTIVKDESDNVVADDEGNPTYTTVPNVKWYHYVTVDGTVTKTEGTTQMSGTEPELSFTYTVASEDPQINPWLDVNNKVIALKDVPVTVKTTIVGDTTVVDSGNTETETVVSGSVKYYRNQCENDTKDCADVGCQWKTGDVSNNTADDPAFVIHIYDTISTLTINKTGMNAGESAIFTVTGTTPDGVKTFTVVVPNDGSVTIGNLVIGTSYKVEESGSWTWKYTPTPNPATGNIDGDPANNHVVITNSGSDKWLNDEAYVHNDFSKDSD